MSGAPVTFSMTCYPFVFPTNIFIAATLMRFLPWCPDNMNLRVLLEWQFASTVLNLNKLDATVISTIRATFLRLQVWKIPSRVLVSLIIKIFKQLNAMSVAILCLYLLSFPQPYFLFSVFFFIFTHRNLLHTSGTTVLPGQGNNQKKSKWKTMS